MQEKAFIPENANFFQANENRLEQGGKSFDAE